MSKFYNRVRHATATTGTGTLTLGQASTGYLSATEAGASDGAIVSYTIEDGNNFEIGRGVYGSAGQTLTRAQIFVSKIDGQSANTSPINLSGSAIVFLTAAAADIVPANNANNIVVTGGDDPSALLQITSTTNATKGTINLGNATSGSFINEDDNTFSIGANVNSANVAGIPRIIDYVQVNQSVSDICSAIFRFTNLASYAACYWAFRARGSLGSEAIVHNDDRIVLYQASAWDGSNYQPAATIEAYVDGTPGEADMPGRWVFKTTPANSPIPQEAMTLLSDQTMTANVKATGTTASRSLSDRFADVINVKDFGAVGNGIADDTTKCQAALDLAASLGISVYFPAGTYLISAALTVSSTFVRIYGDGSYTTTIQPATNVQGFEIDSPNPVIIEGLGIIYASAQDTGLYAITITSSTSTANGGSRLRDVLISGADSGIQFTRSAFFVMENVFIEEFVNSGVEISNAINVDSGDSTIANCTFFNFNTNQGTGIYWHSSGGLRVTNTKFGNLQYGIANELASAAVTAQLVAVANSFDTLSAAGIIFSRAGATGTFNSVTIGANIFAGTDVGISIPTDANGAWLEDVAIVGNTYVGPNSATAAFVAIDSVSGVTIIGNPLTSNNSASVGITVGFGASDVRVNGNTFRGTWAAKTFSAGTRVIIGSPDGIGYGTGSGGTVTQITSKATSVTLNKLCGQITMHNASLAGGASVAFQMVNSTIASTDYVGISVSNGVTVNAYDVSVVHTGSGLCNIRVTNKTGGALTDAVVLNFTVIKGVTS